MNATDFEYDGLFLSDFGYIICEFDGSYGVKNISAGSVINFNRVASGNGSLFYLTSANYDECLKTEFDICKDPETNDDMEISIDEFRDLMRWLNRKEFLPFQIYDDEIDYEAIYFDVSFNIEKITIGEKLYGLHLIMETNRPFGYGEECTFTNTFTSSSLSYSINDISDEIGVLYPYLKITCNSSGTLRITNSTFDSTTEIKNCTNGEVITIDCEKQIITTSRSSHSIYNDFNYEFLKIGNTYNDNQNIITVSKPCVITFTYTPIIKVVP